MLGLQLPLLRKQALVLLAGRTPPLATQGDPDYLSWVSIALLSHLLPPLGGSLCAFELQSPHVTQLCAPNPSYNARVAFAKVLAE